MRVSYPSVCPAAVLAVVALLSAAACGAGTAAPGGEDNGPEAAAGAATTAETAPADNGNGGSGGGEGGGAVSSPSAASAPAPTPSPAPAPTMTETERQEMIEQDQAELAAPATPAEGSEDNAHDHDDGHDDGHDNDTPTTTTDTAEETETATTVPAPDDDGDAQPPAEELDPDALLPGEQPPDPVVDFDEDTDQVGEIVMLRDSVQLTKIREACPERFVAASAWDECEDYLSTGSQYRCVYQPIRLTIGSRYQTPPQEWPSPDPRYDTYQVIYTYTVLGFQNIPQEWVHDPSTFTNSSREKIWFNVTERAEATNVYPGREPFMSSRGPETIVRSHVAVGGDDAREYENGQLVGALVAIEESQSFEEITCPARELVEQILAEQGLGLDGQPLPDGTG